MSQALAVEGTTKRIALLHLAPALGRLRENREEIERGTRLAASLGANWVLSGELVVPGFHFEPVIGTDWIVTEPSRWLTSYAGLARELGVSLFINHPERHGDRCFNTLFAFDTTGVLCGRHRKVCVTPLVEDWSTAGDDIRPVMVDGVNVGLLVCADAYPPEITTRLKDLGAEVLLSSAAWHPGEWGPSGEWEARSAEAQLPLIVCNRTGVDADVSFTDSESVLIEAGRRVATLTSRSSTVFLIELDLISEGSTLTLVDQQPIPS
jgi:predicted amidohydrolase